MSRIPTLTLVTESVVIFAFFSSVWYLIKLENFADFWSFLSKSKSIKGNLLDIDVVKWSFKDRTILEVKQEAHSVCFSLLLILLHLY